MKKTYTKPEISFESFLMSTNIAGDCEIKPTTNANYNLCGYLMKSVSLIIFGTDLTGCNSSTNSEIYRQVDPNTGYNGLCYHTPTEAKNIFNS